VQRLILDLDLAMGSPGSDIDDGFALALALAEPDLALELVTTVNGNTDVDTATTLTLELLRRLGRLDVPVRRGARRPLLRPPARPGSVPAAIVVGQPRPGAAAVAMVEHVLANPGEIILVAVGPLTNVALAMRLHDEFAASLRELVIMGGVYSSTTNQASMPGEFNVWSDPEAAQIVLTSGVKARWLGLDVTLQVRVTKAQALRLQASGRQFASFAGECTAAWIDHLHGRTAGADDSCPLHDPLAVAALAHPELVTFRDAYVQVELGDRARGVMIADYLDGSPAHSSPDARDLQPNAQVAVAVDAGRATQLLLERISAL
jgi:purine nucleosidase